MSNERPQANQPSSGENEHEHVENNDPALHTSNGRLVESHPHVDHAKDRPDATNPNQYECKKHPLRLTQDFIVGVYSFALIRKIHADTSRLPCYATVAQ